MLGDKAEAYYTSVLKKYYPLPVFEGENDVEKGVLWNRIAGAGLKIRWFNEKIYFCEYLDDGMSKNIRANYIKNFNGYSLWVREILSYKEIPFLDRLKHAVVYFGIFREKKIPMKELKIKLNVSKIYLLLVVICYIVSLILNIKPKENKDFKTRSS